MDPDLVIPLIVLTVGLCFGSFVTLASWRLPRGEDVIFTASRCPACRHPLEGRDMVPVFSLLLNRMRCRYCKAKVSARYPLIELATAALVFGVYLEYGMSWPGFWLALAGVALMVMIVVDFEHYLIPDEVQIALLALAAAYHYSMAAPFGPKLAGLAAGLGIGLALRWSYRWLRGREGLGMGDVKFLAVCGFWLGMKPIVPFLFFAGIFGVLTALIWRILRRGELFPFGPALAMSLFLCLICPPLVEIFYRPGLLL